MMKTANRVSMAVILTLALTLIMPFAATGQDVIIEVFHRWDGSRYEHIRGIMDQFEELHPGVKIVDQLFGGDLNDELVTAWLADTGPDVAMMRLEEAVPFAAAGFLQPLDPYAESEGVSFDSLVYPSVAESIIFEGNTYYLPGLVNLGRHNFYYNQRLFEEAGFDSERPPETHSELKDYAQRLTRIGADGELIQQGISLFSTSGARNFGVARVFLEQWGTGMFDVPGRTILPDVDRAISVVEWMLDVAESAGGTVPSGLTFTNEKVAMHTGQDHEWFSFGSSFPDLQMAVSHVPVPDEEPLRSSISPGWGWGMSKSTNHPEIAWELVKWLSIAPEGGGKFSISQGRVSASREVNLSPEYFEMHPYWPVTIEILNHALPGGLRCPGSGVSSTDYSTIGGVILQAGLGEADPNSGMREAKRVLQAMCDDWWSDVSIQE